MFLLLSVVSCGQIEKSEGVTASEEAAMIEGRNAARPFLHRQIKDTTGLSYEIKKAKAPEEKYLNNGMKSKADAFDSGFTRTIRTVNPPLSKLLEK